MEENFGKFRKVAMLLPFSLYTFVHKLFIFLVTVHFLDSKVSFGIKNSMFWVGIELALKIVNAF